MDTAVQLMASGLTMASMWFYGSKLKLGPVFGLLAQVPWWIIMIHGSLWGILPVNSAMLLIHSRNLWKWMKEAHDLPEPV